MNFADLKNRHIGETVTMFGTGPSLDALDLDAITGPRILLHRAAFVVPHAEGETYWLVLDDCWGMKTPGPWAAMLQAVKDGSAGMTLVVKNPLGAIKRPVPAPEGPNIVRFDGHRPHQEAALHFTREQLADSGMLYTWSGSAGPAVHLAWFMGAKDVVLVGCDGEQGHAGALDALYTKDKPGGFGYRPAHDCMMQAIQTLKIPVRALSAGKPGKLRSRRKT